MHAAHHVGVQLFHLPLTKVGQNHISAPYMTVCIVISLPEVGSARIIYLHRVYGDFPAKSAVFPPCMLIID
jgi:hypothetical protein